MSDAIQVVIRLDRPDLADGHDLYAVLHSALKSRSAAPGYDRPQVSSLWPASHFGLDRVSLFREASDEDRESILQSCSRALMAESYYIEKCGIYFASKMSLLAESTQEQMLYSLFASDEAVHFHWISNYCARSEVEGYLHNPFIEFLAELLEEESKPTLTYIVQVILEGWGISHYHGLAKDCNDAGLTRVFENVIRDEARHHGSGLILFDEQKLSSSQIKTITDILKRFFQMVQIGPQMVVSQIERCLGHLSKDQKIRTFEELRAQSDTAGKIENLKSLIGSAGQADAILTELERSRLLRPCTAYECAAASI
jgi:rubrerythrin